MGRAMVEWNQRVTELTLASARDAIRLLAALKAGCPGARVIIVANKVAPSGSEISRKDFETSIERVIDIMIPLGVSPTNYEF